MKNVSKYEGELPKIMIDFLDNCVAQRKSEHTVNSYAIDLKKWFKYQFSNKMDITEKDISDLKLIDLDRYIATLNDKSVNTILRSVATIKSFYKYLTKYEMINNNIAINISTPKKPKRNPKFLSVEEIKKLINMPNKMNVRYPERDIAILTTFVGTGMRLSELVNIKKTDIKDGMLRVIGKGDKERFVPLADRVTETISKYLVAKKNNNSDTLFVTERNSKFDTVAMTHLVKKYLVEAGLGEFSTHKLRHTAATQWYQNGTDIKKIQELLGHSNIQTTGMYTHNNGDKKEVVNNIRW